MGCFTQHMLSNTRLTNYETLFDLPIPGLQRGTVQLKNLFCKGRRPIPSSRMVKRADKKDEIYSKLVLKSCTHSDTGLSLFHSFHSLFISIFESSPMYYMSAYSWIFVNKTWNTKFSSNHLFKKKKNLIKTKKYFFVIRSLIQYIFSRKLMDWTTLTACKVSNQKLNIFFEIFTLFLLFLNLLEN